MTDPRPLLPPNRTPWETAAEMTGAVRFPALDPSLIKSVINPATIPLALLPWLAWMLGLEIWSDDWSEARQRWAVANSISFHRMKGTLAGLRAYLGLVDADIVAAIVPPAKTYLCPAMTPAQRAAYLALFPELRVYPYVAGAINKYGTFDNVAYGLPKAFVGSMYPATTQAEERYTRTSILIKNGVTTNLTLRTVTPEDIGSVSATSYDQITLPSVPSRQIFPGAAFLDASCFGPPFDPSSVVLVPVVDAYVFDAPRVAIATASAGLSPIDVTPDDVAEVHTKLAGQAYLSSGFLTGVYLPPSIAWQNIFQRWWLFDPTCVPPSRKSSTFLDWTRLGMPPYTAELQIDIQGQKHPGECWGFVRGCLRAKGQTQQQINDAMLAVRLAKSERDQIFLKTKTVRPIQPLDLAMVGQAKVGQWVPAPP